MTPPRILFILPQRYGGMCVFLVMDNGLRGDRRSLIGNGGRRPAFVRTAARESASGLEVAAVGQGAEPAACKNGINQWVEPMRQGVMPRSIRRGYTSGPTDAPWGRWYVPRLTSRVLPTP